MALSNNVIGAINFVAMLLSIPVIGAGIWLANQPDNSCLKILQWPVIVLGILILVVALAGFIGGFWRIPWLLIAYLVGMLILIILLACLVVFIYMVTIRGSGHLAPSRTYLEYHLEDYSGWLQRRVRSSYKWERIKVCLSSTEICAQLNQSYTMAIDFFNTHLSPIESGCCKPPTECGYTFGLTCNLKAEWRKADIILLITLIARRIPEESVNCKLVVVQLGRRSEWSLWDVVPLGMPKLRTYLDATNKESMKHGGRTPEIPVLEFGKQSRVETNQTIYFTPDCELLMDPATFTLLFLRLDKIIQIGLAECTTGETEAQLCKKGVQFIVIRASLAGLKLENTSSCPLDLRQQTILRKIFS
ncbi:protein TORNADO 2-like [Durio zibethinus]|uniref:Protein TORNADO 2-like n=1 Tax=Durio zibethinus TaxID=66656 RepID=A0A6P5Y4D9_DURZI|nr:protein TORNADO 2-like [Durio zibethinus]